MSLLLDENTWREQRSIRSIAKAVTVGGIRQLWAELKGHEGATEAACEDEEVAYLGRCFQDMAAYTAKYAHCDLKNERSMDMHAVASFAKLPGVPLLFYGELMSNTDQQEKQCRCNNEKKKGKFVDYLYQIDDREIGLAENSGPYCKRHEVHAKENLVHLAKTARSQILELTSKAPNCESAVVPLFHVLDGKANFYIEFAFAPDLFAMHRFQEVPFPTIDSDILSVLELVEAFLMFRDILANTALAIAQGHYDKLCYCLVCLITYSEGREESARSFSGHVLGNMLPYRELSDVSGHRISWSAATRGAAGGRETFLTVPPLSTIVVIKAQQRLKLLFPYPGAPC
ncbi:hypothetical protein HDU87_003716 [Geranomyces variabilis]|uniref:Uncharacterized protein n=1 Tax=Geranomyces variabilis TaxID=109894 RepID=A0AAD5XQ95_9FUNG|nr:hypothetical protein HDU87_003716 [Geranomyces variabilis]